MIAFATYTVWVRKAVETPIKLRRTLTLRTSSPVWLSGKVVVRDLWDDTKLKNLVAAGAESRSSGNK